MIRTALVGERGCCVGGCAWPLVAGKFFFHQSSVTVHQIQKAPALEPGPVIQEENAAPHHEWDSTIRAFRSFKANLREVYVIGLAVAEPGC
jgi:hypothetical protein